MPDLHLTEVTSTAMRRVLAFWSAVPPKLSSRYPLEVAEIRRYQAFVSSTYVDLLNERQKVLHALLELGCFPAGMEFFPADNIQSWEHVTQIIDDSDFYILIIGGRYGSIDEDGLSFTEREYNYAKTHSKHILAFLHAEPGDIPAKFSEITPRLRKRLDAFRSKVRSEYLCRMWRHPDELATQVTLAVTHALRTTTASGWVRGSTDIRPVSRSAFHVVRHREVAKLQPFGFENELEMRVRAQGTGVEVCFRQTGGFDSTQFVGLDCVSPGMTLLQPGIPRGEGSTKYFIHLGRQLGEGEETTVKLIERYTEENWTPVNQFGYYVAHGLEYFEQTVLCPPPMTPTSAYAREYLGDAELGELIRSTPLWLSDSFELTMIVEKPEIGRNYIVEVHYDEDALGRIMATRNNRVS